MTKDNRSRFSRRSFLAALGATAAGLKFSPRLALAEEPPKLNFYNWDTYIGEDTLDNFGDATGIDVTMDLFADNDELFAKLKGGNPGYDVIVPTNDYVERMITAGMLVPLDQGRIANVKQYRPDLPRRSIRSRTQIQPALHVGHYRYRLSQVTRG